MDAPNTERLTDFDCEVMRAAITVARVRQIRGTGALQRQLEFMWPGRHKDIHDALVKMAGLLT